MTDCRMIALSRIKATGIDSTAKHIVSAEYPLMEALRQLNALGRESMTLFAIDNRGKICGSLTDGDIRRALISGIKPDDPVKSAMHGSFRAIMPDDDRYRKVADLKSQGIDLVPVLDSDGFITDLIDLRRLESSLPIDAVLMAGGKGERLRPLTEQTPKPLLAVGGKAIIDYNIENLARAGVENVFVTVNYLKDQIIKHFETHCFGVEVKCVAEEKRTGTFGSLALINGLSKDNVLVMNSDLLTSLSLQKMYDHHLHSEADLTMAVVPYSVSVPFAILHTEDDRVTDLEEKPVYNYFANAGVYILKRSLIGRIPYNSYADAPDFIRELIKDGGKVCYFPVDGMWVDIGSPSDYRHACELMSLVK